MFIGLMTANNYDTTAHKLTATNLEDAQKEFVAQQSNDDYVYESWEQFTNDEYHNNEMVPSILDTETLIVV